MFSNVKILSYFEYLQQKYLNSVLFDMSHILTTPESPAVRRSVERDENWHTRKGEFPGAIKHANFSPF